MQIDAKTVIDLEGSKPPETIAWVEKPEKADFGLDIKVYHNPHEIGTEWAFLERCARDQSTCPAWSIAWYDAHKDVAKYAPVIILGRNKAGKPVFLLPLLKKKIGPFNVLVRPGWKHSAYFGCLFSPELRLQITSENNDVFWQSIFCSVPDIDAVIIDGLAPDRLEQDNPLIHLPLLHSENPSFRMAIGDDWQARYTAKNSSKVRSNDRRREKRLAETGKLKFHIALQLEEKYQLLSTLLQQKSDQFAQAGSADPFNDDQIHAFYKKLIEIDHRKPNPSVFISALLLDGEPLAVNMGLIHNDEFHGLLISMRTGDCRRFAPGRQLLLNTARHLSGCGIKTLDFGVGEMSYKSDWCDETIQRFHVLAPLNIKGQILVQGARLAAKLKGRIKRMTFAKNAARNIAHAFKIKG
jgi:CelD/BcsL family acetyltransferase involved in cellulose biosynthesis